MEKLYAGIDLHATSLQICVVGEDLEPRLERTLRCDPAKVVAALKPFGSLDVAFESCFNWYWLADALQDAGHVPHLAHALAVHMITRAKVKTDRRDALKLARLLATGMLPEGYIYPRETRPIRDLVRQRTRLVTARARGYASIRLLLYRHGLLDHSRNGVKAWGEVDLDSILADPESRLLARQDLERIALLSTQIAEVEARVLAAASPESGYARLSDMPGFGRALSAVVFYETGDIRRFPSARHYASYCRLVPGTADSGSSSKRGRGSRQGNPHLKAAFTQAAQCAVRHYPRMKEFYERHTSRHPGRGSKLIATSVLGHRLASAAYHILKEGTDYRDEILFSI
jgi:transposase